MRVGSFLAINCPPIGAPTNGKMTGPNCTPKFRGKCYFDCNPGYLRNGPAFRECLANKQWSGTNVQCDGKYNDIEHMTSWRPSWCLRTMKWQPLALRIWFICFWKSFNVLKYGWRSRV